MFWIRYRRGLTFRDYLRAVRGYDRQHQYFGGMIRLYEPIGFGRRAANRESFDSVLASYLAGFDDVV